ncbi:MAG TPA: CoA-binding protein [Thermoplasmata archaeon]|nr:CoA-binding protein [Thermoplasmata archaeon]
METSTKEILTKYRTIGVVGCSKDPAKDAHTVPAYMQAHGYRVIPVNPTATEILGERAYPNLSAVSEPYDIVNIFRPSDQVEPIVDEAIRAGKATVIWMQTGIVNEAAAAKARAAGMVVVMDRCMRTEHRFHIA